MSLKPLVVITRPKNQSISFAKNVQAMGRSHIIFPVFDIKALEDYQLLDEKLRQLKQYQLLMFVSPNAVAMVLQRMRDIGIPFPENISVAVVGEASKASLYAFGINESNANIISPKNLLKTDSETLFEELPLQKLKNQSVLIFRGETGREFLSERLIENGIHVERVCAYRRIVPEFDEQIKNKLQTLLQTRNDWVVTSSSTLKTLISWASQLGEVDAVEKMQHQRLFVPHIRIEQVAQELGFQSVIMTSSGDEKLLLALQSSI